MKNRLIYGTYNTDYEYSVVILDFWSGCCLVECGSNEAFVNT